jgi:hypothetical protein
MEREEGANDGRVEFLYLLDPALGGLERLGTRRVVGHDQRVQTAAQGTLTGSVAERRGQRSAPRPRARGVRSNGRMRSTYGMPEGVSLGFWSHSCSFTTWLRARTVRKRNGICREGRTPPQQSSVLVYTSVEVVRCSRNLGSQLGDVLVG